ncbi:MAG: thioesterase family protein [Pseudomonadota bacterium]
MVEQKGRGATSFETAFQISIAPETEDFDELGHVNNAVYLRWAQSVAVAHWTTTVTPELVKSRIWVILRSEIDYRDAIVPGDEVIGRTWLGVAKGPKYERFVDIRKPNAARPAASIKSIWCMLNFDTRRPMRIGSDVFEAFGVADQRQ